MMKRCYIWIMVCWTGTWGAGTVMGQHHQGGNVSSSFAKFVDISVSHYTGVPQIGIPLATAQEGPLKVPISLAYHSSVKVGELASEIGLGWQLMGGGAIYRNVRGMMDEDTRNSRKGYYLHGSTMTNTTTTLNEIQNGSRDGEANLFSFYMPGYSGKFYFEGGNGSTPSDVVLVPEQDLREVVTDIECPSNGFCYIRGLKIIAPDGTRYYFGKYNHKLVEADIDIDQEVVTSDAYLRVYPNPAPDYFKLESGQLTDQSMRVEIRDAFGRKIWEHALMQSNAIMHIDCSKWSSGVYFVYVNQKVDRPVQKILVP